MLPVWRVTDNKDVIGLSFFLELFYINGTNVFDQVKRNVYTYFRNVKPDKQATMPVSCENIWISQNYVVFRVNNMLISFRFDVEKKKVHSFTKIKHSVITDYENIEFGQLITTSHPDWFLFSYKLFETQCYVVWNIKTNREQTSFIAQPDDSFTGFVHGNIDPPKTKEEIAKEKKEKQKSDDIDKIIKDEFKLSITGYLMFSQFFVNLDTGIPSPILKYPSNSIYSHEYDIGRRMSRDERFVLSNTSLVTSFSYQDICFKEKRNEFSMKQRAALEYFIDRDSVFTDHLQEPEKLKEIIDVFESDPIYYTLILTPDQQNVTPLDEAIDRNSIKVVELFLQALSKITSYNLSKSFYKKFNDVSDL